MSKLRRIEKHIEILKQLQQWNTNRGLLPMKNSIEQALTFFIEIGGRMNEKDLAEILHSAGIDAWQDYADMGKSAELWNKFRLDKARSILAGLGGE